MRHGLVSALVFAVASLLDVRSATSDAAPPPPPAPVPPPVPTPSPAPAPTPPAPPERAAEHGYLGFQALPAALLPSVDREVLGVTAETGVVVVRVFPGGPADKAGLKVDDVLTNVGGHAVPDVTTIARDDPRGSAFAAAFQRIAAEWKPGAEVELVARRGGKPVTLEAVAIDKPAMDALLKAAADKAKGADGEGRGEPPPPPAPVPPTPPTSVAPAAPVAPPAPPPERPAEKPAERGYLGFEPFVASAMSAELRASLGIAADKGVVVVRMTAGGPADRAGLKVGDVLAKLAGHEIPDFGTPADVDAFAGFFRKLLVDWKPGAEIELVAMREGKPVTLKATAVDKATIDALRKAAKDEAAGGGDGKGRGEPTPTAPGKPERSDSR